MSADVHRPDWSIEERVRFALQALVLIEAAGKTDTDAVDSVDDLLDAMAISAQEAIAVLRGVQAAPGTILNWRPDDAEEHVEG